MKPSITLSQSWTFKPLLAKPERQIELKELSQEWASWSLTPQQICDLELLLNGGFSPLKGFMTRQDYDSVLENMRLADNNLWPVPIVLDVPESFALSVGIGETISLRDPEGYLIAVLHVEDMWKTNRHEEAEKVFGTNSTDHPGVDKLLKDGDIWYLGGTVEGVMLPKYYDFSYLRLTPQDTRDYFSENNWNKVVAFQTRNPMHRAHQELTLRALEEIGGHLLIHPVVGLTKPGDVDHFTRVRCYQNILPHYPENSAMLALLPLAMRMAGPREALWHAIIRKNYGCSHFIVGRDHASPGVDSQGKPFYGPYDAQELLHKHQDELGIQMVPFKALVYEKSRQAFIPMDEVTEDQETQSLSGTELREYLRLGKPIPSWFTYPEVAKELQRRHPPRHEQGFTVFFTGLSGSGKSTIANALQVKLQEYDSRTITLLDGDLVRKHLSSELSFTKEHRNLNVTRIGYVASEITKSGGIALCAPIAPYESSRKEVQQLIEGNGGFILVHVSTSLEVCEERDTKGLYAKARKGIIKQFTGISDPYEAPDHPHISIDTQEITIEDAANAVVDYLFEEGYLKS